MNEVIVSLQQKLENMKTLVPTEAATPEQISKYFNENEDIIAGILKAADSQTTATTSELEGIKEAVKELRNLMRKADTEMKPLSYRDVCYNLGKALCRAWKKDAETLGQKPFWVNQSEILQTMTSILSIQSMKRPSCRKLQSSLR